MKAWLIILVVMLIVIVAAGIVWLSRGESGPARPPVVVGRGTVERIAVATGRIEPAYEVEVRSQFSGLVAERFVELGDRVEADDPLVDVRQVVTKLSLIQAERAIEAAERGREAAVEFLNREHLASFATSLVFGDRQLERQAEQADLSVQQARETLEFLETGKLHIGDDEVDTIVRAPVAGQVIDLVRADGQRVIPVGSYQPPTEIARIADMDHLEFRGTVDEIDVGSLTNGLPAEVSIGALPGVHLQGRVHDVGRKAKIVNNATVFDVWITVDSATTPVTRAGYSATAEIFIARRENVLVVPERVVEYRDDRPFVRVLGDDGTPFDRAVTLGLGDGLMTEVTTGLQEGDRVLEREYPKLE